MTEREELMEAQQTIIEYANEIITSTNKRLGEINLGLKELGVEDENLYFKKFEEEEDFETLDTLLEKLDIYELDLLRALLSCASAYGMEQVMTATRRKSEMKKFIDERYEFWLKELEEGEE